MIDPVPSYRYGNAARLDIQGLVPNDARAVLDVGCGTGVFGRDLLAARPNLEMWGIDPEPAVASLAEQNLSRFVCGFFPADLTQASERPRFDCVTFNDSLEHFVDPWDVLTRTRDVLSPTGVVIASIPNIRNYAVLRRLVLNGEWEYRDTGILDRTHLRFFTRSSAQALFVSSGYRVAKVIPLNVASGGRAVRALALFGKRTVEFRALQFAYVAHPI